MFPITKDKFLLKFLGKSLLEHQVERAKKAGLNRFVIIANAQSVNEVEQIVSNLKDVQVELAIQQEPHGIADALVSAQHFLDEEIIVVNPNDVFQSTAYTTLLDKRRREPASSYILGYETERYFPGGYLVTGENSELIHIVEKPGKGNEPSNIVNIMVHLHTDPPKLLDYVRQVHTTRDDVYECALDSMIKGGHKLQAVRYQSFWAPIKYPWHIFMVAKHFLEHSNPSISPSAHISEKAIIEGNVTIADNVRVFENAVIRGPAYIGPNSIIGNNALIRDHSHIGANCVVGYCTEVKGAYIEDNCWFHSNYIGDSIIAEGCSFGAGTILANQRFDEGNITMRVQDEIVDTGLDKLGAIIGDNCKTGINISVMPGVRIGSHSFVGSHVCLARDLEANKMILAETRYRTIPNEMGPNAQKKEELFRRLSGDNPEHGSPQN